jgi:hypothetical protein
VRAYQSRNNYFSLTIQNPVSFDSVTRSSRNNLPDPVSVQKHVAILKNFALRIHRNNGAVLQQSSHRNGVRAARTLGSVIERVISFPPPATRALN